MFLGGCPKRLLVGNVPLLLDVGETLGFQPLPLGMIAKHVELGLPLGFPPRVLGLDAGGLKPRMLDLCIGPRFHVCRMPLIGLHAEPDEGNPAPYDEGGGKPQQHRHGQQHEQGKQDGGPAGGVEHVFGYGTLRLWRVPVL